MLKEHSTAAKAGIAALDAILLCGAFWGAYLWRSGQGDTGPPSLYLSLLYISIPVTLYAFHRRGLYAGSPFDTARKTAWNTLLSLVVAGVASSAVLYLLRASYFSRLLFGYYFVLASGLLLAEKIALKAFQDYLRSRGHNVRHVVAIGAGKKLQRLLDLLARHPQWGFRVLKVCSCGPGTLAELREVLEKEIVDEVYVAFSRNGIEKCDIGPLLGLAERFGKVIKVAINLDEELDISRVDFCHLGDMPALAFYSKTLDPDQLLVKRIMDIAGALAGLGITAILLPFIALAIKLDSAGPVLFGQIRVGLNGRRFRLYKFRSMYADAEAKKKDLLVRNERLGPIFKLDDDPRVTRVGRFLRRTSLDELPQFWNVLKGEMSLVGTRPPTPDEVEMYQAWHYRRISIRPGITGLWQISRKKEIRDFDQIVALDLQYISQWSVGLDLRILLKTLVVFWQPWKYGSA